jgi:hypothetical protein
VLTAGTGYEATVATIEGTDDVAIALMDIMTPRWTATRR